MLWIMCDKWSVACETLKPQQQAQLIMRFISKWKQ